MPRIPPKHSQFKKGQSGNPLGGKLADPEMRAIKRLTKQEIAEIGSLLLKRNIAGLQKIVANAKDPESKHSALKVWMATICIKGMQSGDAHKLDVLLNRLVGKVTENIQLTGADGGPIQSLTAAMTKEERIAEIERLRKARKEAGDD